MMTVVWWFVQLLIGVVVGALFPKLDLKISRYLMEKKEVRLAHRSFLFFVAVLVMDVFQVTSSLSPAGFGALLGLHGAMLRALQPVWTDPVALKREFFWDLAPSAPAESLRGLCIVFGLMTIVVFVRTISLIPR